MNQNSSNDYFNFLEFQRGNSHSPVVSLFFWIRKTPKLYKISRCSPEPSVTAAGIHAAHATRHHAHAHSHSPLRRRTGSFRKRCTEFFPGVLLRLRIGRGSCRILYTARSRWCFRRCLLLRSPRRSLLRKCRGTFHTSCSSFFQFIILWGVQVTVSLKATFKF